MKASERFAQQVQELLKAVQRGEYRPARAMVRGLSKKRIPRPVAWRFAEVARRAGAPELAVRALNRIVRPSDRRAAAATEREMIEYAAALGVVGSFSEAHELLEDIDGRQHPLALLHRTILMFYQWEWTAAIPLLEELISLPNASSLLIPGRVRLGGALIYGARDYDRADRHLAEVLKDPRMTDANLYFVRDALLYRAQLAVLKGDGELGRRRLDEYAAKFKVISDHDVVGLHLRMWRAIADLVTGSAKEDAFVLEMNRVHDAFRRAGQWERARSTEYYKALYTRNDVVLERLYFGSPHAGLRRMALKGMDGRARIPGSYLWHLSRGGRGECVIDVRTGRNTLNPAYLKPGQIQQRVIEALASDLYRPMRISELFERVYEGEHYNPWSSPVKVRQAIKRTREWLESAELPLRIEEEKGTYRFDAAAPCALRVYDQGTGEKAAPDAVAPVPVRGDLAADVAVLLKKFPGSRPFSVSEAAEALGVSVRSALRVLADAVEQGLAERRGRSSATRYLLKSEAGSKALAFDPAAD